MCNYAIFISLRPKRGASPIPQVNLYSTSLANLSAAPYAVSNMQSGVDDLITKVAHATETEIVIQPDGD